MKKYSFTGETMSWDGLILHRIRANVDIPMHGIKAGTLGGWIQSKDNLSQYDSAWVAENAKVYENAFVGGHAYVGGNANIHGNAIIEGNVKVYGEVDIESGCIFNIEMMDHSPSCEQPKHIQEYSKKDLSPAKHTYINHRTGEVAFMNAYEAAIENRKERERREYEKYENPDPPFP